MIQYKIRITRQAKKQLEDIRAYISSRLLAPETAKVLINRLRIEINDLSYMPERFKLLDEEPWKSYGIRKKKVGNYYIYYWINEEKKLVQIITVIYVKMDQKQQLQNSSLDMH